MIFDILQTELTSIERASAELGRKLDDHLFQIDAVIERNRAWMAAHGAAINEDVGRG